MDYRNYNYIDFEGIKKSTIKIIMENGNTYLNRSNVCKLQIPFLKLFGMGNITFEATKDQEGYVISVTQTGKEHCIKMQNIMKYKECEKMVVGVDYL